MAASPVIDQNFLEGQNGADDVRKAIALLGGEVSSVRGVLKVGSTLQLSLYRLVDLFVVRRPVSNISSHTQHVRGCEHSGPMHTKTCHICWTTKRMRLLSRRISCANDSQR